MFSENFFIFWESHKFCEANTRIPKKYRFFVKKQWNSVKWIQGLPTIDKKDGTKKKWSSVNPPDPLIHFNHVFPHFLLNYWRSLNFIKLLKILFCTIKNTCFLVKSSFFQLFLFVFFCYRKFYFIFYVFFFRIKLIFFKNFIISVL